MLKVVGRIGYLALLEHQPGRNEPVESLPQLAVRRVDRGPQQLIGKLSAYRGPGLDDSFGRPQSVYAFHEQRLQTVRNGQSR
jgi:hypothetical protein